jgi:hypothetical protein
MEYRPSGLFVMSGLIILLGLVEAGFAIHDHGLALKRDLLLGLTWIGLGTSLLINGLRKPAAPRN